jgi:tRNA modification GTPase
VRDGYPIALVGAPNAGKSTLLNGLAERDAAIVTDTPGTTRDIDRGSDGVRRLSRCLLADTAGLRETRDTIEAEGCAARALGLKMLIYGFGSWTVFT